MTENLEYSIVFQALETTNAGIERDRSINILEVSRQSEKIRNLRSYIEDAMPVNESVCFTRGGHFGAISTN